MQAACYNGLRRRDGVFLHGESSGSKGQSQSGDDSDFQNIKSHYFPAEQLNTDTFYPFEGLISAHIDDTYHHEKMSIGSSLSGIYSKNSPIFLILTIRTATYGGLQGFSF